MFENIVADYWLLNFDKFVSIRLWIIINNKLYHYYPMEKKLDRYLMN